MAGGLGGGWQSGQGASSGGNNNLIAATFDFSDTTIYSVATTQLAIPAASIGAGLITLSAALYNPAGTYAVNSIVRSDGTNGGTIGLCYKNLTGVNAGTLADANWAFADALGGNVGNIEISTFGNPNTLSATHLTKFKVAITSPLTPPSLLSVLFKASPFNAAMTEGQIALDMNTDVLLTGIGFLTLFNEGGIAIKQYLALA